MRVKLKLAKKIEKDLKKNTVIEFSVCPKTLFTVIKK